MNTDVTAPTPERIFNTLNAYQQTRALQAAIELDLFTQLSEGPSSAEELAVQLDATSKGTRILCDYLVVSGFLFKENGMYRLGPDVEVFLNRKSPAYLGGCAEFLLSPALVSCYDNLAEVVRTGGTMLEGEGTVEPNHPIWVDFARGMAPLMIPAAEFMAELVSLPNGGSSRILDIAAGHGMFGITFARRNPSVEVVAADWPAVLEVAAENAVVAGVEDRHFRLEGDVFQTEWGNNYQLILATNFFHHFDLPTCKQLMEKMHRSLNPGGRVVTLEFVPNQDRVSPPESAAFSLVMLASTRSGDAYTFREYEQVFAEAGFERNEVHQIPNAPQQVIVSHKVDSSG